MSQEKKPVVAITIGDPAGIGPEITVATMMDKGVYDECNPFLIGSVAIVERAMKIMGCDFAINRITHPEQARFRWGTLDIMETGEYDCDSIEWGKVQKLAGEMSLDYVMKSIELGMAGLIDVVST
ncbi:4-hydroxythreonine-4-phosphate dehydrogenase PdxA, partial [Pseudomonas aeruginosa]